MNKEIWKDIQGYEQDYQVSNFGRVRSIKFGKVKISIVKMIEIFFILVLKNFRSLYNNSKYINELFT